MIRKKSGDIEWLEFELLSDIPNLKHGVFLRHGGVSQGLLNSLNVGKSVGDTTENVNTNVELIRAVMDIPDLKWSHQIHGKEVCQLNKSSPQESDGFDGIMTSESGLGLMCKHADCQATLFYDPVNKAIATVHAGWRGSAQNIYLETIRAMRSSFGSNPSDLLVCISPSLGPEKAEFIRYHEELPRDFWPFQLKPNFFDFWTISEQQLMKTGILHHHIEVARICTYSNPNDYFSYRRDRSTGRHATCVALV